MCAINGITTNNVPLVTLMNARTKHRGPDGSRVWESDGITLGHNRLAIIDLSDRALQPMQSMDARYSIVFNGEIYNYRELRAELVGQYTFKTESDTEVLLAAYIRWGMDMFPKLRGMFAFGIWDGETHELLLARDHMGIKPLYYTMHDGVLTFSSEIPALLSGERARVLDTASLAFYLSQEYVPGPGTLVEGVQKLRPGQVLRFKKGVVQLSSFLETSLSSSGGVSRGLYDTIDAAVERQLVSDRPVGAYLSGGFDSSIVVHHMTKYTPHAKTYSVDFEPVMGQEADSDKFNHDARLAEKTAAFYGADHTTFRITLADVYATIEKASQGANEPIANSTAITQFLLSDFVRKDGVVVVLGGDGGDELFGGYTRHRIAVAANLYQKMPKALQHIVSRVNPRAGKLGTPFGSAFHMALMAKDEKKIYPFLKVIPPINDAIRSYFDEAYRVLPPTPTPRHPVDAFMRVDRETWLPDECFVRSDYASMAHGIELRVPFVDLDVVQAADRIPVWKKTFPHEGKRIIRETYRPYLPSYLYHEPKRGWLSPAAKWFRDPAIGTLARNVLSSGYYSGLDSIFDWKRVEEMLDAHIEKRGYYLYPLWNILVLQIWARQNTIKSDSE